MAEIFDMYVYSGVCTPRLVLGRHPKINLFGLHYCVICCEVETKYGFFVFVKVGGAGFRVMFKDFEIKKAFSVVICFFII